MSGRGRHADTLVDRISPSLHLVLTMTDRVKMCRPQHPQRSHVLAFARGRLLAIAALAVAVSEPSAREWRIVRRSANRCESPLTQLELLLIEAVAPSPECADPAWHWMLTRERDCADIIRARLYGYMPAELLNDASKTAAAVVHGATVAIKRRPKAEFKARELGAITEFVLRGSHA